MRRALLLLAILFVGGSVASPAQPSVSGTAGVEVTYLANEGFLIAAGETKVLVDALFGDGIELGGLRLLHVGDTEVTLDDVRPYALGEAEIDVFFVPAWYFSYENWRPVVSAVGADARVVMHLAEPGAPASWFGPDGSRAKRLERILAEDLDAIVIRAMETRRFP